MTPKIQEGALSVYQFGAFRVRIVDQNGEPWWILADVCEALGIGNAPMVAARLVEDEKSTISLADGAGGPPRTIVNEPGLYNVILRSDKPEAKGFKAWVTHEVLPSIRKTGSYGAPFVIPKTLPEALRLAADLEEKRALLEAKVAEDAPKVESFEALMRSEKTMSITDAAKHFGLHPKVEVFPYLRARGYLTREDLPTQAAIDAGYLSLKVTHSSVSDEVYQQAVVEAWQLETWRAHVVHQVKRWLKEVAA